MYSAEQIFVFYTLLHRCENNITVEDRGVVIKYSTEFQH